MSLEFDMTDFSLLPSHIIAQILGYLKHEDFKNASSVCKSWLYASTDPQIIRNRVLQPTEKNFLEICQSLRKYGVLKLKLLKFDKMDSYYFELFEKFCPFIHKLHIIESTLKIHHLLKLLELSTNLEAFSLSECHQLVELPGLFPIDCEEKTKNQIVKNLCSIKHLAIGDFRNIPFIADLVRYSPNLETIRISIWLFEYDGFNGRQYKEFFKIFDNYNADNLKDLNLNLNFSDWVDDFITNVVKIQNLNLRSFRIGLNWNWEGGVYKSFLFRQLLFKLRSLVEFKIDDELIQDQLAVICQNLIDLESLECPLVHDDQPVSEITNLKLLKRLQCNFTELTHVSLAEIDTLFKCKFEYLQIFKFQGFVSERNLTQFCENHPNLIQLEISGLLTRNLEVIFKHLTKLQILDILFGFHWLTPELRANMRDVSSLDTDREYQFKLSRLQDLEEFYLDEKVNGIRKEDIQQLKKLRSTNVETTEHVVTSAKAPQRIETKRICPITCCNVS